MRIKSALGYRMDSGHHRKSVRLPDVDYASAGLYFITICAFQRQPLFGDVVDGAVVPNGIGILVASVWRDIPQHHVSVGIDEFVIMPNHIHGIISLSPVGARFIAPDAGQGVTGDGVTGRGAANQGAINRAPTVGEVVRAFKARCTFAINRGALTQGMPVWQRNYHEHMVRDERSYLSTVQYIRDNPQQWQQDVYNSQSAKFAQPAQFMQS